MLKCSRAATAILPAALLLAALQSVASAASHSSYANFAEPLASYSLSSRSISFSSSSDQKTLSISSSDQTVYRYAYVSTDGQPWKQVPLSGSVLGGLWLNGTVTAQLSFTAANFSLTQSKLSTGRNFVVVYSCSRSGGLWDCHDGWQIWQFDASIDGQSIIAAVNAGTNQSASAYGITFGPDTIQGGDTRAKDYDVPGTDDDDFYRTYRLGNFTYSIPAADGHYNVTIYMIEPYYSSAGQRSFDVKAEGEEIISDLDIYAQKGYLSPFIVSEEVCVDDGSLTLEFISNIDLSLLNGFKVVFMDDSTPCASAPTCTADGSCPSGCAYPQDPDCDQCTTASSCPEGTACQTRTCTGTPKRCGLAAITSCMGSDGCCPSGCAYNTDSDCEQPPNAPLRVSSNGRHLIDERDEPFFLAGDTAWSLIVQTSRADADYYLQTRSNMGFNLVLVNLIEHQLADNAPANYYGDEPFTGKVFATPNEAYFAHADYVIDSAAAKGLYVLLDPLYIGWQCQPDGWCTEIRAASESDLRTWGRYVGNRYKDYDNIIWLIGGDVDPPTDIKDKVRVFVAGIMEEDPNHLFTAHNVRGQMAIDPWPNEEWLTLNDVYTTDDALNQNAKRAYEVSPAMPFFLLESYYEHEHGATLQELHEQSYAMVLSGGFGGIFGNCPLWGFGSTTTSIYCTLSDWKLQLNTEGSKGAIYAKRLFLSRDWSTLVPDFGHTVMTSGYGTLGQADYATAALTADKSTFIAYLPSQRTVTVNTGTMSGSSVRSWWYNPRDGTYADLGTAAKITTRSYETPSVSGPDWVLVIDDASKGYGPPGQA